MVHESSATDERNKVLNVEVESTVFNLFSMQKLQPLLDAVKPLLLCRRIHCWMPVI